MPGTDEHFGRAPVWSCGNSGGVLLVVHGMKAVFNGQVIAESDETVVVEGNHYFPPQSVKLEFLSDPTGKSTFCHWKGEAAYRDVVVAGETASNAAWFYPTPKEKATEIKDHIAFYPAVTVS